MNGPVLHYVGALAWAYDFQTLLAALTALTAATVALLTPQIQNQLARGQRRRRLGARLRVFEKALTSYEGGLLQTLDILENAGDTSSQTTLPFSRQPIIIPFPVEWDRYVGDLIDLVPPGLLDVMIEYEAAVRDLNALGTTNGVGIVVRNYERVKALNDDVPGSVDGLQARLSDAIQACGDLGIALKAQR